MLARWSCNYAPTVVFWASGLMIAQNMLVDCNKVISVDIVIILFSGYAKIYKELCNFVLHGYFSIYMYLVILNNFVY